MIKDFQASISASTSVQQKESSIVQVPPVAFNLKDAAAYTGLSAWSLRVAFYSGELPAKRIGKTLLFTRAELDAFVFSAKDAEATNPAWLVKRRKRAQEQVG